MGIPILFIEFPCSMVARFQVRGHSSCQPSSRLGSELAVHHLHCILLIKVVNDSAQIQGGREIYSTTQSVWEWLQRTCSRL